MKIPYNELTPDQKRQVNDYQLKQQKAQANVNNAMEVLPVEQQQAITKKPYNQLTPEQKQQVKDYQAQSKVTNVKPKGPDLESNNPLIPIGQAMTEMVGDAEIIGKDFLASVGLGKKEEAAAKRKEVYSERMQYAGTPVGQSKTAQVLGAATNTAAVAASGVIGKGLGGIAAMSGLTAAAQDPGNVEDPMAARLKQGAIGAGLGLVGGAALNKVMTGSMSGVGSNFAKDAVERGAATVGQATGSKVIQSIENTLSKIPLVGTRKAMEAQVESTQNAIKAFTDSARALPEESFGATIATSMAKVHADFSNKSDLAYTKLVPVITNTKAGSKVILPKTKMAIAPAVRDIQSGLRSAASTASQAEKDAIATDAFQVKSNEMLGLIEKITSADSTDFATAHRLAQQAGELYRETTQINSTLANSFLPVVRSLENDTANVAARAGLGKAWTQVSDNYANVILPMRQFVKTGINAGKTNIRVGENTTGIDTSGLYTLFKNKDVAVLPNSKAFISSLGGDGKNAVKNVVIGDLWDKSVDKAGNLDFYKYSNNVTKVMKNLGLVADAKTMQTLKGLQKIVETVKLNPVVNNRLGQTAQTTANIMTQRLTGAAAVAGMVAAPSTIVPVAAVAVATKLLSKALTAKSGIKGLQYIARLNDKNPKTAEIISGFLTRWAATSAGPSNPEDVNPQ